MTKRKPKNVVHIFGVMVCGDGYSHFYDKDADTHLWYSENPEASDGFIAGLEMFDVDIESVELELSDDGDEDEAMDWFRDVCWGKLTTILDEAEQRGEITATRK